MVNSSRDRGGSLCMGHYALHHDRRGTTRYLGCDQIEGVSVDATTKRSCGFYSCRVENQSAFLPFFPALTAHRRRSGPCIVVSSPVLNFAHFGASPQDIKFFAHYSVYNASWTPVDCSSRPSFCAYSFIMSQRNKDPSQWSRGYPGHNQDLHLEEPPQ